MVTKSGLPFVVATGLAALGLRALGFAPLADLMVAAYLAAATLTFGRPRAGARSAATAAVDSRLDRK